MSRIRVDQLAFEFGTTPEAVIRLLRSHGFPVRGTSTRVDAFAVEWLRVEFTVEPVPRPAPLRPTPGAVPAGSTGNRRDRWPNTPAWSWRGPAFLPSPPVRRNRARSMRTVPVFSTQEAARAGVDFPSIERGLEGSPYSLARERKSYLETSFLPRMAALSIRGRREAQRLSASRRAVLRRITRTTEVFESNQIEGLGPDLTTTDHVLSTYNLHTHAEISIAQQAIQRCLSAEPKVRDVVGLGAARILAETYCAEPARHMTESDVRQLHELLMVGDSRRGAYKGHINEIQGSAHVPTAPSDTPAAMSELITWLAATSLTPLWRAAVVHAWLTHIHPFHDGNGRVARLLANLVLIGEGMPPLIVRAAGDRGAYIDALAASDTGGDILPLARVFRDVLSRAVNDLGNPSLADQVFDAELATRSAPAHVRWTQLVEEFLSELAPQLLLHRLNLYYIGEVTDADLMRIGVGRSENAWIAKVRTTTGDRDLLLHVAAPTSLTRARMRSEKHVMPSIFVSVRSRQPLEAQQYSPVGSPTFKYEFTPMVGAGGFLVRRDRETSRHSVADAGSVAADHLARVHTELIGRPS